MTNESVQDGWSRHRRETLDKNWQSDTLRRWKRIEASTNYKVRDAKSNKKIKKFYEFNNIKNNEYTPVEVRNVLYKGGKSLNTSKIIDLIIDLVFDKHCKMKETSYQNDKLVCDDLINMKEELKEKLNKVVDND